MSAASLGVWPALLESLSWRTPEDEVLHALLWIETMLGGLGAGAAVVWRRAERGAVAWRRAEGRGCSGRKVAAYVRRLGDRARVGGFLRLLVVEVGVSWQKREL